MSNSRFIRVSAVSAVLAGALRAISSFTPDTTPKVYLLYFVIDLLLLFGVAGLFRSPMGAGKVIDLLGFVLMILALLILIARDAGFVPVGSYPYGAGMFSAGLDLLAIQVLRNRKMPKWIPVAWILSTILGAIGFLMPGLHMLFTFSGLLFGLAFAGSGIAMWRGIARLNANARQRL